jgi:hemerythrin-like domain-containing protein
MDMDMPEETLLDIKYRCMHPSCVVNCREGELELDPGYFKELTDFYEGDGVFKSPQGVCRMGFSQKFMVVTPETSSEAALKADAPTADGTGPIDILMAEHQWVLKKLDEIEIQVRRRDVEALWTLTGELINEIIRHSLKKEEEVLFPVLDELIPLAEGLVAIVREDHAEFMNLLHSFRVGLSMGDIMDGVINSMIVNLRNHIRKEDGEFFTLIRGELDADMSRLILDGMKKIDDTFVPLEIGELSIEEARKSDDCKKRRFFEDQAAAAREATQDDASAGGACCHE